MYLSASTKSQIPSFFISMLILSGSAGARGTEGDPFATPAAVAVPMPQADDDKSVSYAAMRWETTS